MNKGEIIQKVKELQKIICSSCKENYDYEACLFCKVYILTNEIINLLNGG